MSNPMISFDIETLGTRSNAVVLSIGVVRFSFSDLDRFANPDQAYKHYVDTGLFVKLNVREQAEADRSIEPDTLEWWKKQAEVPLHKSFKKDPAREVSMQAAVNAVRDYSYTNGQRPPQVWARGSLDQVVFDDLCKWSLKQHPPFEYWEWADFRTAINCTKDTARRGYCDVKEFDRLQVVKHDPVHDAALDVIQLLWGE